MIAISRGQVRKFAAQAQHHAGRPFDISVNNAVAAELFKRASSHSGLTEVGTTRIGEPRIERYDVNDQIIEASAKVYAQIEREMSRGGKSLANELREEGHLSMRLMNTLAKHEPDLLAMLTAQKS